MTSKNPTKRFFFLGQILNPNFPQKNVRILVEITIIIVQIWNVIPRWTRYKISSRLAFKPKNFIFLPFFAKKCDVPLMKKSKIDQNLDFPKSTQKWCISLAWVLSWSKQSFLLLKHFLYRNDGKKSHEKVPLFGTNLKSQFSIKKYQNFGRNKAKYCPNMECHTALNSF